MFACDKLRIGQEFLKAHAWPQTFHNQATDRCYCERCYSHSEPDTRVLGDTTYVVPRGWTRFGITVDEAFVKHHQVWENWASCFHGTTMDSANSIITHRMFLLPLDKTMDGVRLQIRAGHIPGEIFVFTTPTIAYAALDVYTKTYEFRSFSDGKRYQIKVALQCKQQPGTFIIQPETVNFGDTRICQYIPNDEIEWKTQNRGAIMAYGLMLHIEPKPEPVYRNENSFPT